MGYYFYHPLGEQAVDFNEYSYYSYAGHAVECVDIGVPSGTPVYSMTTGVIEFIGNGVSGTGYNGYGGVVVIRASGVGYTSLIQENGLYILYAHLREFKEGLMNGSTILAGDLIGYSGGANGDPMQGSSTGSHLHLEFKDLQAFSTNSHSFVGMLSGQTQHISNWDSVKNWSLALNLDGTTPTKIGDSFSYLHAICSQLPEYIQGGTELNPTVDVPKEYLNYVFSERFMGKYPATIDDNEAIKILTNAATREFGYYNEGISYGKLFRAWILYQPVTYINFRAEDAQLVDFANEWCQRVTSWGYDSSLFKQTPTNISQERFLELMQDMYKNIANPGIFGLDPNSENYNEAIIACSNMPYSNETTSIGTNTPVTHGQKIVFQVISPIGDWAWYVLFRCEGSLLTANNATIK